MASKLACWSGISEFHRTLSSALPPTRTLLSPLVSSRETMVEGFLRDLREIGEKMESSRSISAVPFCFLAEELQ